MCKVEFSFWPCQFMFSVSPESLFFFQRFTMNDIIDLQNNTSVWPHRPSPPPVDTSWSDAAKSAPWPSSPWQQVQFQGSVSNTDPAPAATCHPSHTHCRFHKPIQPEIFMSEQEKDTDFEPTGIFLITSGLSRRVMELRSTKYHKVWVVWCCECCSEMLWDIVVDVVGPREMKELQVCSWVYGQDSLLWNIIMKPNLSIGSFQKVWIWCPAQMDTMHNQILRNTVFYFNCDKQVHVIPFSDDNKISSLMRE